MSSDNDHYSQRQRFTRTSQQRPYRSTTSAKMRDDFFEDAETSSTSTIRLDDSLSESRRSSIISRPSASSRTSRISRTGTIQEKSRRPVYLWEVSKRAFFTIPYLVGVIVILFYIFQWFWLLFKWLLGLLPQIANSPVVPQLANISGILQGLAVITGFLFFIFRLFKKGK